MLHLQLSLRSKLFAFPQLANDPRAAATACSSRRSCVASFPTLERDGLLFAWMDNSPEGLKAKVGLMENAHGPWGVCDEDRAGGGPESAATGGRVSKRADTGPAALQGSHGACTEGCW